MNQIPQVPGVHKEPLVASDKLQRRADRRTDYTERDDECNRRKSRR